MNGHNMEMSQEITES